MVILSQENNILDRFWKAPMAGAIPCHAAASRLGKKPLWSAAGSGLINPGAGGRAARPMSLDLVAYLLGALSLVAGVVALAGLISRRLTAQAFEEKTGDRT